MNRQDIAAHETATPARLNLFHLIAYVLPSLPLAALGLPIVVYLPQFYASREMGISLGVTGAIFSLMRIFDVAIDPITGYWSDRLHTRIGRRRPLILFGAPVLALGIWMIFVPGGPVSVVHLCFWLAVMYLGWTMCIIPHLSWGSELSSDYHERSRVYGWSMISTIVGMVGVLVLPAVLEHRAHATAALQVMSMAIFAIALLIPSVALCVAVVPEPEIKLKTHAALLPTLRFLLSDRAIRRVMAIDLIDSTSAGARGAMFFFFARIALGLPNWSGLLLLIYFVTGCLAIPFWIALSRRIGKHRALLVSYSYGFCVAPMLFFLPKGALVPACVIIGMTGITYGAPSFLLRSMMADIADADTAESGAERAGLMYSFLSLTNKFGIGWAVGIAFVALAWMGFDPKIVNTPQAIEHMRDFYIGLPVLCGALCVAVLIGYPLDEARQKRLRADVERLRASHVSADDILPPTILPGGAALASDSRAVSHLDDGLPLTRRT
jgi:Na+/melibiose symporter-like transporter